MAFTVPPPKRPKIRQAIEAMKPRTDLAFPDSTPDSIKTIVARVRVKFKDREYLTAKAKRGAHVWRLK